MGLVAAQAIIGNRQQSTDAEGAMRMIGNGPIGVVALVLIAVGLFGYMAWRLVAAVTDAENKGDQPTALVVRAAPDVPRSIEGAGAKASQPSKRQPEPAYVDRATRPIRNWCTRGGFHDHCVVTVSCSSRVRRK